MSEFIYFQVIKIEYPMDVLVHRGQNVFNGISVCLGGGGLRISCNEGSPEWSNEMKEEGRDLEF